MPFKHRSNNEQRSWC